MRVCCCSGGDCGWVAVRSCCVTNQLQDGSLSDVAVQLCEFVKLFSGEGSAARGRTQPCVGGLNYFLGTPMILSKIS